MSAPIVVVHDDIVFVECALTALKAAGHDAVSFAGTTEAVYALTAPKRMKVLVTSVLFAKEHPVLELLARNRGADIRVLFASGAELEGQAPGVGAFLPLPAAASEIVTAVEALLNVPRPGGGWAAALG